MNFLISQTHDINFFLSRYIIFIANKYIRIEINKYDIYSGMGVPRQIRMASVTDEKYKNMRRSRTNYRVFLPLRKIYKGGTPPNRGGWFGLFRYTEIQYLWNMDIENRRRTYLWLIPRRLKVIILFTLVHVYV